MGPTSKEDELLIGEKPYAQAVGSIIYIFFVCSTNLALAMCCEYILKLLWLIGKWYIKGLFGNRWGIRRFEGSSVLTALE